MKKSAAQQFKALNGAVVTRKDLQRLLALAKKENETAIIYQVSKMLDDNPDTESFELEIAQASKGLNAPRHSGLYKEALDECGRLRPGFKFEGGSVVRVKRKGTRTKPAAKKTAPAKQESKPAPKPKAKATSRKKESPKATNYGKKKTRTKKAAPKKELLPAVFMLPNLPAKYDKAVYNAATGELQRTATFPDETLAMASRNMLDLTDKKLFELLFFKEGYFRNDNKPQYRNVPTVYRKLTVADLKGIEKEVLNYLLEKLKEYQYETAWNNYSFRGVSAMDIHKTVKANIRTVERLLKTLPNKEPKAKAGTEKKDTVKVAQTDKFTKKYGISAKAVYEAYKSASKNLFLVYEDLYEAKYSKYTDAKEPEFEADFVKEVVKNRDFVFKKGLYTNLENIKIKVEPLPRKPYTVSGANSLKLIVSKDKLRPNLQGYFVEKSQLVATDALKLVIIKQPQKANIGKIVSFSKERGIIDGAYPDYKRIVPDYKVKSKYFDIQLIIDHCNSLDDFFNRTKNYDWTTVYLSDGDGYEMVFRNIDLLSVLLVLQGNGAKKVQFSYSEYNRAIRIDSDNGNLGVIMPVTYYISKFRVEPLKVLPSEPSDIGYLKGAAPVDLFSGTKTKTPARKKKAAAKKQGLKACHVPEPAPQPDINEIPVNDPEPVVPPKPVPKPVQVKKNPLVMSSDELMSMEFESLQMDGPWADFMQDPAKNMKIAIWGKPKNGKTSGAAQLANYLTKFGNVLYNFVDQGFNKSTQDIWRNSGMEANPRAFATKADTIEDLKKLLATGDYQFVFIDMINDYIHKTKIKPDEFKEQFIKAFPDISFILVFEVTKTGNFKGDQGWTHIVDAICTVEDFLMENRGRYGVGHFIVWEEGFKKFNPKKYAEICEAEEEAAPEPEPAASVTGLEFTVY